MFQNIQIEGDLPTINDLDYKRIQQSYLMVILLNFFVVFTLCIGGLSVALFRSDTPFIMEFKWNFLQIALLFFFFLLMARIIGFSKRKYAIRERDISYKEGVFWTSITTVPFCRIQHVELNEAPVSRLFKLATLNIYTAGDSASDLKIKGLKKEEALRIKEFITSHINGE
ncbi:MAG: hypothetical protein COB81_05510 [Flavobacteriaceae bacterium]|nr:MAG: hypothetical protein COB81_05510 [Flavobacteriaceae bacterium]